MKKSNNIKTKIDDLSKKLKKILYVENDSPELDFYISSLTEHNPYNSTEEVKEWLTEINEQEIFSVETIPLAEIKNWYFDQWKGDLTHKSGKFFSIKGLKVQTNKGPVKEWTQPILYQPEIGILGIITKKNNGILYFLMQAKAEPGNINSFQISPTVQATRSNYTQVHGGKPIPYLEYFFEKKRKNILVDQFQSEQGARFYKKRNRNIIIQIENDEDIKLLSNFKWLTLGQIKKLLKINNTINMDARSVLSNISFIPTQLTSLKKVNVKNFVDCLENSHIEINSIDSFNINTFLSEHNNTPSLNIIDDLLRNISQNKFNCDLETSLIPLNEVKGWKRDRYEIYHNKNKYFSIIGVRVTSNSREVSSWDQPIIKQVNPGLTGFIVKEINNVNHFLIQLKMESGNMDLLELAPTVQCITGSYEEGSYPPFVNEFLNPLDNKVIIDAMQSEEGGRFFQEENKNIILLYKRPLDISRHSNYIWMTMKQIKLFLKFNNFLNVESRSLLSQVF